MRSDIFTVSARIWIGSLLINSSLVSIYNSIVDGDWISFGLIFSWFIPGFAITAPLLIIVYPLVKYTVHIPYSDRAQAAWLAFTLATLVISVFIIILLWARVSLIDKEVELFLVTVYLSIVISVAFSGPRLQKLKKLPADEAMNHMEMKYNKRSS